MHPLVIIVPAVGLMLMPQFWVKRVLRKHNSREDGNFPSGGELAKEILARYQLDGVKVESTDLGDHYDPNAKAVRLTRDKIERKTLTAITTAAHETAHAIQDATDYGPFVWRVRLVNIAKVTGQVGTVVLIMVPAVSMFTRYALPPVVIGVTAISMLGTGVAAQLAALPTELDASFGRAMPLLKERYISEKQAKDAQKILLASSLTYVASSLLTVLNIWPWLGWGSPIGLLEQAPDQQVVQERSTPQVKPKMRGGNRQVQVDGKRNPARRETGQLELLIRTIGKPVIRGWFRLSRAF
jgi:hypothetical protein